MNEIPPDAPHDLWLTSPGRAARILLVFWTGFLFLYSIRGLPAGADAVVLALPRRAIVSAFGGLVSWGIYLVLRRRTGGPATWVRFALLAALSVGGAVVFSAANSLIFYALEPVTGEHCLLGRACTAAELVDVARDYSINWTFLFAAWGMLLMWLESMDRASAAEGRASLAREATRVAEIRALRYQVNPHFLFNCLNSLGTLVRRQDKKEAQAMINELGDFLRYGLATDHLTDVNLLEEVEMQSRYLALERRRFGDRLSVEIDVAPDVRSAKVPSLILQPLVENSIRHGVALTAAPVRLTIRARKQAGVVTVAVEDDAWADPKDALVEPPASRRGFGIGLRNVAERLEARYGGSATLAAAPRPEGGFRSELTFPAARQ